MINPRLNMRRFVWTKQTISIARVDEEILVDVIPFSEEDGVEIIPSQLRGETAREHRRSFEQALNVRGATERWTAPLKHPVK
jgi:hypothetical protein